MAAWATFQIRTGYSGGVDEQIGFHRMEYVLGYGLDRVEDHQILL